MEFSKYLAIIAGLIYIFGYILYNRNFFKGVTKPKITTWGIWVVESIVFTKSYSVATSDDWESIIPKINVVFCTITFLLTLTFGTFVIPKKHEWCALGIVGASVIVWKITGSAEFANYIAQAAIIIGFFPTWEGIWSTPSNESSKPWWLWTISYSIATIVAILRWKGQYVDIVYPMTCIILHASVPIICNIRARTHLQFQSQVSELKA